MDVPFSLSYWNGRYRMLVMESYNARVQAGPLISQRTKRKLREGNGWPEDIPHIWVELDLNPKSLIPVKSALHSPPLYPLLLWAAQLLLYSASCTLMIYLLYKFSCKLPTALHVLFSLMGVWLPMVDAQVWYCSVSQEQGRVQICPPYCPWRRPTCRGMARILSTCGGRSCQRLSSPTPWQLSHYTHLLMCSFSTSPVIRHVQLPQ